MDSTNLTVIVKSLSFDASEGDVYAFFGSCGDIVSVSIPVYEDTGKKRGSAIVQFSSAEGLDNALLKNGEEIVGRPVRINKDRRFEKREKPDGCLTVFVGNVSQETTEDDIRNVLESCGAITTIRKRAGFAHVEFAEEDAVDRAVALSGTDLGGQPINVDFADRPIRARTTEGRVRRRRGKAQDDDGEPAEQVEQKPTVFVGNIAESTEADLRGAFASCGTITSVTTSGRQNAFAHVEFVEEDAVDRAVALSGTDLGGQTIRVEVARAKRAAKPRAKKERSQPQAPEEAAEDIDQSKRVFVGNISPETTEEDLRSVLEVCGAITSVSLRGATSIQTESGKRAGFAHVEFAEEDAVDRAVALSGTDLGGQTIRVEIAKAKPVARAGGRRRRPRND